MPFRSARLIAGAALLAAIGAVPVNTGATPGIAHALRGRGDFASTIGAASLTAAATNQPTPGLGVLTGTISGGPTVIVLDCVSIEFVPASVFPPAPTRHEVRASGLQVETNTPVWLSIDDVGLTDTAQLVAGSPPPPPAVGFPPTPCGAPHWSTTPFSPVGPGDFSALP